MPPNPTVLVVPDHIGQATGGPVHIPTSDLEEVDGRRDLGPLACSGDHRLDLVRHQALSSSTTRNCQGLLSDIIASDRSLAELPRISEDRELVGGCLALLPLHPSAPIQLTEHLARSLELLYTGPGLMRVHAGMPIVFREQPQQVGGEES